MSHPPHLSIAESSAQPLHLTLQFPLFSPGRQADPNPELTLGFAFVFFVVSCSCKFTASQLQEVALKAPSLVRIIRCCARVDVLLLFQGFTLSVHVDMYQCMYMDMYIHICKCVYVLHTQVPV